ncbi:hypothetical protein BCV70DRAFT_200527 [Testicularia cyperi]|uniref:Pre-mRNA-splicing factor CWC2 n=1 Tax=Testicularia cyperi TaxID=1882483 RepID=A0A317XMU8_9BASI|nr:hypothetical protein BCV70DRAFT_200527 [Testicularia cyperi]
MSDIAGPSSAVAVAGSAENSQGATTMAVSTQAAHQPRPARKQVTMAKFNAIKEAFSAKPEEARTYNIWYENYAGADREENEAMKAKRETRCNIARDSGYTKADVLLRNLAARQRAGTTEEPVYCCLHFARGCCPHGVDCNFLHRLPQPNDFPDQARDCFGREKLGNFRDDMSGTGSLSKVNRTLYVGRLHEEAGVSSPSAPAQASGSKFAWRDAGKTLKGGRSANDIKKRGPPRDPKTYRPQHNSIRPETDNATEQVIRRHFSEWGEIDRLRVLNGRSCAFVTYKYEANAQFAKEAMLNQSLDHDEILNIRWASDDPNPAAQKRNLEMMKRAGEKAVLAGMSVQAIEAQHALRALEMLENESGNGRGRSGAAEAKRRRTEEERYEAEMRKLDEENERGWAEYAREQEQAAAAAAKAANNPPITSTTVNSASQGLFGAEAMSNLVSLRSHSTKQAQSSAKPAANGLGSLAAYGSDSEDEG